MLRRYPNRSLAKEAAKATWKPKSTQTKMVPLARAAAGQVQKFHRNPVDMPTESLRSTLGL